MTALIDGNASKPHITIFNEIFFLYHSLYCVNGLYQNLNANFTKMAKIEVANTQLPVCFETLFLCFLNIVNFTYNCEV